MRGDEVFERGDVVIRNNRIAAIGPSGTVAIPPTARIIDVTGKTILPGYVDLHAHIPLAQGTPEAQPYSLLAHLAYGVTTVRDPQTQTQEVLNYQDLVATGEILGPRFLSTASGVWSKKDIRSLNDARMIARRYSDFYHTQTLKQYVSGDREVRQWLVMAAREFGLTPTNEGSMADGLTFVLDGYGGMEHVYNMPSPIYGDIVRLIASSGTTYDPTIFATTGIVSGSYFYRSYDVHGEPKLRRFLPHSVLDAKIHGRYSSNWFRDEEYLFPRFARDVAKIVAAGGLVAMGGHGDLPGLGSHFELWALASGGLRAIDVLRIGTMFGAEGIGLAKELGSLEPGKLADLQILEKNPLENIRNTNSVRYVMKNGRLYDASTLDQVWPLQKKLPEQWWSKRDSALEVVH